MRAPIDLNLVAAFTTLYEAGSFTAAAQQLGVPRSTVSRRIAELEHVLGEQLVRRTTRTMAFTPEGRELFDRVAPSLARVTSALVDRPSPTDEPAGKIRVTSTPDVAALLLSEAAVRFTSRYPKTSIELVATDAMLDLVRDGIDLALRTVLKRMPESGLVGQKVGTVTAKLFAAPSYIARRGMPRTRKDLASHERIAFRGLVPPLRWTGSPALLDGRIATDNMSVMLQLVRNGGGIGMLPTFVAADDLQAGTIVEVLPKLSLGLAALHLVTPTKKYATPRLTAFKDLVRELLRHRPHLALRSAA